MEFDGDISKDTPGSDLIRDLLLSGDEEPIYLLVRVEAVVSDPDRDSATVRWWRWKEVDSYPGEVTLSNPAAPTLQFRLPDDATPGQVIQLVVEATDSGQPSLTRYQRVVVSVTEARPR